MLFPKETDILENQKQTKLTCTAEIFEDLDYAASLIECIFPELKNAESSQNDPKSYSSLSTQTSMRIRKCKLWIGDVFEAAISASRVEEFEEIPPEVLKLPEKTARKVIQGVLKILTCGNELSDNGYMFLSDVANALEIAPFVTDTCIEQHQYEKRKNFTLLLRKNLTEKQRFWVARMLWRAIHADRLVHTREYKYFENILQLLDYDQGKIARLEKEMDESAPLPFPGFDPQFKAQIFQYIVEIVMIDGEYSTEEASLIKTLGNMFEFDEHEQDNIIQPVASALMLRRSLF
ncbi:MAG: TerB family tellurite resistance protein [SAR324 cluster bacterium]|nr:TerB family tellurite resistance protein [SAR324 cluster bacterium]